MVGHPVRQRRCAGISGFNGDTATLGSALGSGSATVTLDGSNPNLSSLTFNDNQGGSYTLSQGSGGAITLSTMEAAGHQRQQWNPSNRIPPLTLTAATTVTVTNPQDALTIGGNVTATGGLMKYGAGTLSLAGTNTFSGPLVVNAGTLQGSVASLGNSIANNAAPFFNENADATFAGTMTGTGAVAKMGCGKDRPWPGPTISSTRARSMLLRAR